jgi:pimeloyl-ACP methyl ester carboxylesterase
MDQVDVSGLTIGYERVGTGPPLVLLNGYVGNGAGTWRHQLDDLSDEFTVVAWDSPGSGRSSDPSESFGIVGYADCLAGFIDALGFARAHVAGLSFGGTVALALHGRHPRVATALILAGAYAGWAGSLPPDEVRGRLDQALVLASRPRDELVDALLPTMFSGSVSSATHDAFVALLTDVHPAGFRAMARAVAEADLRAVLPQVDVPTLVVHGEQDVRAPRQVADELHAAIPGSVLVVLPDVGHLTCMEAPGAFNAAVRAFLHDAQPR